MSLKPRTIKKKLSENENGIDLNENDSERSKNGSEAKSVPVTGERKSYRTGSKKDLRYEGMRAPARSRDSAETEKIDDQKCRQGLGTTTKELVAEGSPPVWTNWQHKTKK